MARTSKLKQLKRGTEQLSFSNPRFKLVSLLVVAALVGSIGLHYLAGSHAASPYAAVNASNGTLSAGATVKSDTTASNGKASIFGGMPASPLAPPAALPQRLGIGVSAAPNDIGGWVAQTGIPFDYVYQYLSGGAEIGWQTWNANGQFPLFYAQSAAAGHHVPVFSYYNMLQSASTCGSSCSEAQNDLTNLNNVTTMTAYLSDFTTLMKRLGPGTYNGIAGFGGTAVVQVEPDLSAYAEEATINAANCYSFCTGENNSPDNLKAAVASTGDPDVASFANTWHGFNLALVHIRNLYAPNVLLGYHVSNWASTTDIGSSSDPNLNVTSVANTVASFTNGSGAGSYDLIFNDVLDRDAGYYQTVYGNTSVWWDRDNVNFPNFHRWESYLGTILSSVGKPGMVWQIPVGNEYFDTENDSPGHTQDNRVEYFFAHPTELTNIGIVGLLFGGGGSGVTTFTDAQNDGITNPAPVCTSYGSSAGQICPTHTSTVSDDDGGYLRMVSGTYYQNPIPLGTAAK